MSSVLRLSKVCKQMRIDADCRIEHLCMHNQAHACCGKGLDYMKSWSSLR